jgi:hypothetical protein
MDCARRTAASRERTVNAAHGIPSVGTPLLVLKRAMTIDGRWRTVERRLIAAGSGKHIVIDVKSVTGNPDPANCLAKGTHTFALQGDKLVAVK